MLTRRDLGSKPITQMTDEELISLYPKLLRKTLRKVISKLNNLK